MKQIQLFTKSFFIDRIIFSIYDKFIVINFYKEIFPNGVRSVERKINYLKKHLHRCNHPNYSIIAAIFIKGRFICYGWNNIDKTHPMMTTLHEHKKLHAELCAINRCKHKHDLSKATLVVYGENSQGQCISKPCEYCEQIIKEFGIKRVVYSTYEGFEEIYY